MNLNFFKTIGEYFQSSKKSDEDFVLEYKNNKIINKKIIDRFLKISNQCMIPEEFFNLLLPFVRDSQYKNDQFCLKIISLEHASHRQKLFCFGHLCMRHKELAINLLEEQSFIDKIINDKQEHKVITHLIRLEQLDVVRKILDIEPIKNNLMSNEKSLFYFNEFIFQQLEESKNYLHFLDEYHLLSKSAFETYYHDNYFNSPISNNLSSNVRDWIHKHQTIFMKENLENHLSDDKILNKKMKL